MVDLVGLVGGGDDDADAAGAGGDGGRTDGDGELAVGFEMAGEVEGGLGMAEVEGEDGAEGGGGEDGGAWISIMAPLHLCVSALRHLGLRRGGFVERGGHRRDACATAACGSSDLFPVLHLSVSALRHFWI